MSKSVAIVTGASQGIGHSTAIRLAHDFSAIVLAAAGATVRRRGRPGNAGQGVRRSVQGGTTGRMPETPAGKYGRPLFQTMSYHDTPEKPIPEMRYLDGSAKPGEKHTYSVIAVNGAGLASKPSGGKSTR